MLKYFLILTFRNGLRELKITLINLLGLSLGMAVVILLYLFMLHELSFERMYSQRNNIYRVVTHMKGDEGGKAPFTHGAVGPVLLEEFPEIQSFVRIAENKTTVIYNDTRIGNVKMLMVDPAFFDLFDFPVIQGLGVSTLQHPRKAVITSSLAQRLFSDQDPVGQRFDLTLLEVDLTAGRLNQNRKSYQVGGVVQTPPTNTHLQFDLLVPVNDMDSMMFHFGGFLFATYLLFDQPMHEVLHNKVSARAREIAAEPLRTESLRELMSADLQALTSIRFGSVMAQDISPQGNRQVVSLFMVLAVLILVIVLANFINLSTARSEKRLLEAGIRKVLGSDRKNIILHYLGESVLITMLSVLISLFIVELFLPHLSTLFGSTFYLGSFFNPQFFAALFLFALFAGVVSGIYPAMHFSRFQPVDIMKGRFFAAQGKPIMRLLLVVFQFAISVFLVICVWILFDQLRFFQQKDDRIHTENILVFDDLTPGIKSSFATIRDELYANPRVEQVIAATGIPGVEGFSVPIRRVDQNQEEEILAMSFAAMGNYKELFGLKLSAGRWLSEHSSFRELELVINQAAARRLGYDNPIGEELVFYQTPGRIVGVVEDFHFESRHTSIRPLVFAPAFGDFQLLGVKVSDQNPQQTHQYVREVLQSRDMVYAAQGVWLDQIMLRQYEGERRVFLIARAGSLVAIIIGLIGLIGLTSYLMLARKKEISVRKVLGASFMKIMASLMKGMLIWVLLANIIAWPLAWWVMRFWLDTFAYAITITPWYFIITGMGSMVVAIGVIVSQSYRLVIKDPVEGLKAE
ncbi:MAG: ABC transporter permease [Bacteroidales bacterium]